MSKTNITKIIIVLELEMEKDVPNIGEEVCRRIVMHNDVQDANVIAMSPSLWEQHAPKPYVINADVAAKLVKAPK